MITALLLQLRAVLAWTDLLYMGSISFSLDNFALESDATPASVVEGLGGSMSVDGWRVGFGD